MMGTALGAVAVVALAGVMMSYARSATNAAEGGREISAARKEEPSVVAKTDETTTPKAAEETPNAAPRAPEEARNATGAAPARAESASPSAVPPTSRGFHRAESAPPAVVGGSAVAAPGKATAGNGAAPARTSAPNAGSTEAPAPLAEGESGVGHVRILANPAANVEIDGKPRGTAPIAEVALAPGTHFVRLDCAALGEAVAQNVSVAPGENITISGDFTGAHGRILVRRATP
jgi:hypothetical protein